MECVTRNWLTLPQEEQEVAMNVYGSKVIDNLKLELKVWYNERKSGIDSENTSVSDVCKQACKKLENMVVVESEKTVRSLNSPSNVMEKMD
jgi:hypothetical protein